MELSSDNFGELDSMILHCLSAEEFKAGREKAKAETLAHIGQGIEQYTDYLIHKKEELIQNKSV